MKFISTKINISIYAFRATFCILFPNSMNIFSERSSKRLFFGYFSGFSFAFYKLRTYSGSLGGSHVVNKLSPYLFFNDFPILLEYDIIDLFASRGTYSFFFSEKYSGIFGFVPFRGSHPLSPFFQPYFQPIWSSK